MKIKFNVAIMSWSQRRLENQQICYSTFRPILQILQKSYLKNAPLNVADNLLLLRSVFVASEINRSFVNG
uniref:Uncharacterized protein n=1 Tax=Romanomermis culicivorax TaxID=13658 RepID=A0A915K660_ROMCU